MIGLTGPSGPPQNIQNDPWFIYNFLSPPPPIVFQMTSTTSTEIYIPFIYPSQINFYAFNTWLPVLSTFTAEVSTTIFNFTSTYQIVTKQSSNYIDYHNGQYAVTGIVLSKVAGPSQTQLIHFPQDPEGSVRLAYIYHDPVFGNMTTNGSNILTAWYNNYHPSTNKSFTSFDIYITSGPPSAPRNLNTTEITSSSFTFNYIEPLSNDIENPGTTLTIIEYDLSGNASPIPGKRYGSPLYDSFDSINNGVSLSKTLTGLFPDSLYTLYARATNSDNKSSSNAILTNVSTLNILPTYTQLPSLSFPASRFYTGTIHPIANSNLVVSNLLMSNSDLVSYNFIAPIHKVVNRGDANINIMRISSSLSNSGTTLAGPSINFSGFTTPLSSYSYKSLNNITLTPNTTFDDKYMDPIYNQGYYLDTSNTITIGSNAISATSNVNQLNVSLFQIGGFINTQTFQFYYDYIGGPPTITDLSISFSGAIPSTFISGVNIIYDAPTFLVQTSTINMGRYFYKDPMLTANLICGGQSSTITNGDLNTITSGYNSILKMFTTGTLTFNNVWGSPLLTNVYNSTGITLSEFATNVNGNSVSRNANQIDVIIDVPSYNLVYSILPQSIPTTISGLGYRIWTGKSNINSVPPILTGPSPNVNQVPYDHSWNISSYGSQTKDPSDELQVFNGAFSTKSVGGYFNYSYFFGNAGTNYSGIHSTGYRYATFAWKIPVRSAAYNSLYFTLNEFVGGLSLRGTTILIAGTTPLLMFYRIENITALTPPPTIPVVFGSSQWIIGAYSGEGAAQLAGSGANYGTFPNAGGLRWGFLNGAYSGGSNIPVILPTLSVQAPNYYIYCRVGLPMNIPCSFKSVSMVIS